MPLPLPHAPQLRADIAKLNAGLLALVSSLLPTAEEEKRRDALLERLKVCHPCSALHPSCNR